MDVSYAQLMREAKTSFRESAIQGYGALNDFHRGVLHGLEWALDKYYEKEENK